MKIWVGVTDKDWFHFLSRINPDEVNFWQPSGSRMFRALQAGEPFLSCGNRSAADNQRPGEGTCFFFQIVWEALQDDADSDVHIK
jgi:hypothetical protein